MAVVTGLSGGWARYGHGFHLMLLFWIITLYFSHHCIGSFILCLESRPCIIPGLIKERVNIWWDESVVEMRKCSVSFVDEITLCLYVSSVAQSYLNLCDPMDCSMPGFPVHHQLPELIQTHVHRVGDVVQASHPLSSIFPPAFSLSQHQGLFQWVSFSHQVAKLLELQHQSFQWILWTYFL